jgi:uncharacterized membrane protein (UPF0136 family)
MLDRAELVDWAYVILLVFGGIMGMVKAGSKVSLFVAVGFGIPLILSIIGVIDYTVPNTRGKIDLIDLLEIVLILLFTLRLAKTKTFMPSGLMILLTVLTLALRHIL